MQVAQWLSVLASAALGAGVVAMTILGFAASPE
jgi:hypothetical protein